MIFGLLTRVGPTQAGEGPGGVTDRHRQPVREFDMVEADLPLPMTSIADFCRRHRIRQLALFGSVLRNDFRPDSDVDVLVEFEPGAQIGLFALLEMQEELSAVLQRPVDLVPKTGLKPVIRESVLASAQVVYAA